MPAPQSEKAWFENEAFWQAFYPTMFSERRFADAVDDVDRVLTLSGIASGAALDLGCGPARHSALLAKRGFSVTAVDRSPFLLSKAREHTAGLQIEFVESDMRHFVRPAAFDLALSLFTSFGYFETPGEDMQVLRHVKASLKPGGVFVLDVVGSEPLAARPFDRWEQLPNGDIVVAHAEVLPGWARIRNHWLLVRGEHAQRFEFELNLYSGKELTEMLRQAGFTDVQIFGSLAGTRYDNTATRLVARAVA
ncbi:MAG TPA: methyltransferase domain-containing protein [Bryobacteraceae bacterium]|jgi:SAM-dependent methyltransferase